VDLIHEQREVGPLRNFCYLLADPATKKAAVVDPSVDATPLQRFSEEHGLSIEAILVTHHHQDHIRDVPRLADETAAKVFAHRLSQVQKDIGLEDGDFVQLGEVRIKALHTPGHSPDSTCYIARNRIWTGDTLFIGECGRVDLPGGSAEQLWESLFTKIIHLPDELVVFPGHNLSAKPWDELGNQKRTNYTLQPRSREAFVAFMRSP
jgi:glyoxylase-like metal-dependent hydrolase (beta-lactamase superfamily II)